MDCNIIFYEDSEFEVEFFKQGPTLGFSKQFQGLSRSKLLFDYFENEKYLKVIV